jgi:LysM repeat protein
MTIAIRAEAARAQSLRGSRASVNRMHSQAVSHDLHFYQTPAGLRRAVARERLVPLQSNSRYRLNHVGYPYVRPATRTFVERLGSQYRAACGERLVVTGAARPATRQPANASEKSVHPTGIAVDLRKPTKGACLRWLRRTLLELEGKAVIEATEEFGPPHFHVVVFPTPYLRHVRQQTGSPTKSSRARRTYVVRRGDSLWEIARRYDTTVARLQDANGMTGGAIRAGQSLVLPAGH